MKEFNANGLPDDLNNWCKQNFEDVRKMFERTVNRNKKSLSDKENTPIELPQANRDKIIQKDDVLNLQIMLNQINNVDDFIKNM